MCKCVYPQTGSNFGTAPAYPPKPASAPLLARLTEREEEAWLRWLRLFSEPDCWSDHEKRTVMLRARCDYQEAALARAEEARRCGA